MTTPPGDSIYFDWALYDDGWMNFNKATRPAMKEFLECFVGQRIASGTCRDVFECRLNNEFVIKVQKEYGTQNAVEYATWELHKAYPKVAKWLAPVVMRSSSMRVIVQKRTVPMLKAPKKLPNFLSDRKVQNYGLIGTQVVCHDYGLGVFLSDRENIVLEDIKWWDGETGLYYNKDMKNAERN